MGSTSVIERSRLLLTASPLPCEPYHDAKRGKPDEAEKTVAAAAEEARAKAAKAVIALAASVARDGYELVASGVALSGGAPGFTLARALSTHAATHAAEGWLFREALIEASQSCGLVAVGVPESELSAHAAASLGVSGHEVSALMNRLGRDQGPPWGRDQKVATMAAIVALSSASESRRAPE